MTDDETADLLPDLPPPPRPLTRRGRRRSWAELPVRTWAVLAAVVAGITLYLTFVRVADALADRSLILGGTLVEATVVELRGTRSAMLSRDKPVEVLLSVPDPDAADGAAQFGGTLPAEPGRSVRVGDTVPVRVDPSNNARRTARTAPPPWAQELVVSLLLAPVVLLLIAVAWWRRRGVLAAWRGGPAFGATVSGVKKSPLAPRSRLVTYAATGGGGGGAGGGGGGGGSVLWPDRLGPVAAGDTIDLVGRPGRAVLATLYR